ncbi:MAG: BolA/IbaG family iron-sulfur metabolism protein [Pontixanthobacter sp.]
MPMSGSEIEAMIVDALPGAQVVMTDLAGDNDHWAAKVTAPQFAGQSRVKQHKMVYDALDGKMGGVLHALQLTTAVPTS